MSRSAVQRVVSTVSALEGLCLADLGDKQKVRSTIQELNGALAEVRRFSDTVRDFMQSAFKPGGHVSAVATARPTGKSRAAGSRFGLTDFILGKLQSAPGQRPKDLVKTLVAETGKPKTSASAGVSTTLTRLRKQKIVRKNRGKWYLA